MARRDSGRRRPYDRPSSPPNVIGDKANAVTVDAGSGRRYADERVAQERGVGGAAQVVRQAKVTGLVLAARKSASVPAGRRSELGLHRWGFARPGGKGILLA